MSFERGSMAGRFFAVPRAFPDGVVERFAAHAMPGLDTLGDGTIQGWTTGRHALDREITEDAAFYGGHLRLALTQAVRKVPESLVVAECRMEEIAHCQAHGVQKVSGAVRREIRKSVEERLIPQAQPDLKQIPFVLNADRSVLAAGALSDAHVDAFQVHFAQTVGFSLIPLCPDLLAMKEAGVNVGDWTPCSFSPDREDEEVDHDPGLDFLTWLWFTAEAMGGRVKLADGSGWDVMIEGPLRMVMGGSGAHDVAVSKGEPLLSAEVKAALLAGKKLRRAKITLANGSDCWTCTLDAVTFAWRSLKVPEGERMDAVSMFQTRMERMEVFRRALTGLFMRFVAERNDSKAWLERVKEINAWVANRRAR